MESNASGAKEPWVVAAVQRTRVGTLWPAKVRVNERFELWSKPDLIAKGCGPSQPSPGYVDKPLPRAF
jgi:hypothetical protein